MDRFDILEVKGLDKGHSIAYDPVTKTHIVGGQGILFSACDKSQQIFLPDPKILAQPEEAKKIQQPYKGKEYCPPESLRFVPNQKSQQLLFSPSGK